MNNFLRYKHRKEDSVACKSSLFKVGLRRLVIAGLVLSFVGLPQAYGQNNGSDNVRYTLSPIANGTAWNSNLGLEDGLFYGGKVGIDFGPLIGLEVSYLTSGNLWTDFSRIDLRDTMGSLVGDQRVKVRRFGGDLIVRWPTDRVAPFVKLGGGVIRLEPESSPKVEKIDVRLGGGLEYIFTNRLRTRAWVEMNRFRLDRYTLAPGGAASGQYPIDEDSEKIRNNLSVGLSLDYAIGQSRFRCIRPDERLQPFSAVELEPLVGRFDFDDSRMSTVTVAGARIGGELNPWVGWGLYYWHGMESDLSDTRPLQSYGGEARFSLASKAGPQPYVSIGAGQIDFRSGYSDSEGTERDDKTALIVGAGIRAEVFSGLQLNVSVRDYMYGEERLDRISGTDEISHNWLLSGALVFGIGGRRSEAKPKPVDDLPAYYVTREPVRQKDTASVEAQQDTVTIAAQNEVSEDKTKSTAPSASNATQTGYVSEKSVVIPVPLEGEIYIRYGKTSRDIGEAVFKGEPQVREILPDTSGQRPAPTEADSIVSTKTPAAIPSPDTTEPTPSEPRADRVAPVSRSELDSLVNDLKSELRAMLAAQPVKAGVVGDEAPSGRQHSAYDTSAVLVERDSVILALREELETSQRERKRLDSLMREPTRPREIEPDSLTEQRIQREIATQVAAALAAKSGDTQKEITQADLQNMMAMLTARMDSVTSQQASVDAARLRDQLQLEVVKQTKSQEEFQRAMEEYVRRYGGQQEDKAAPPAIVITQPAPTPQVAERDSPTTVVIQPDTQYVVIRDSTGQEKAALPITGLDVSGPAEEKEFIDLRPTAYTGFGLEKPKQFILGGRLDIGPITAKEERLRLVPEFALGLGGGGVSIMAVMNAEYAIADIETGDYRIIPYARMGFGVLGFGGDISQRDTEGVLNFTYGVSIDPRKTGLFRGIGDPAVFVEHQIIDLFDLNRVVLGFQWSR